MSHDDDYQPTQKPKREYWQQPDLADIRAGFFKLGQVLLDRYEIFGVRQGGFGEVYFVHDQQTGHEYAVKTFRPEFADLMPTLDQFRTEVDFWLHLEPHPNIVSAHFVEVIDDRPHLFIDYVDGGTQTSLREWLKAGKLNLDYALDFAYQLCIGMEFANSKGEIAHLDLKPENILIDRNGILKITDFGLATRIQARRDGKYGSVDAGTWAYAAPEQILGEPVNSQSDIYSFGIILYEMITGKLPYAFDHKTPVSTQFEMLTVYHRGQQAHELAQRLYYSKEIEGIVVGNAITTILNGCVEHWTAERLHSFSSLRELFEFDLKLQPPAYLNQGSSPTNDYQRAQSLHKIGRYGEALTLYNRLLQKQPENAQLWMDAAQTLLASHMTDTAQSFLLRALRLDPKLTEARQLLDSLDA